MFFLRIKVGSQSINNKVILFNKKKCFFLYDTVAILAQAPPSLPSRHPLYLPGELWLSSQLK